MNPLLRMITKRRGTAKYYHLGAWVLWLDAGAFLAGSQDGSFGLEWAGEEVLAGWRHGGKIMIMMRSRRSREIDDDLDNNDDDRNNSWHRIKTVAIILDNDKTNQIPKTLIKL